MCMYLHLYPLLAVSLKIQKKNMNKHESYKTKQPPPPLKKKKKKKRSTQMGPDVKATPHQHRCGAITSHRRQHGAMSILCSHWV